METDPPITKGCLIVINCGSSSLKFAVFPEGGETTVLKGLAERLGGAEAVLRIEENGETTVTPIPSASYHTALKKAVGRMTGIHPLGIGHRVVQGGEEFTGSAIGDDTVITTIQSESNQEATR
ncbi:MAG: hypothetical protein ABIT37_19620 [Luteolibacter sp.]